MSSAQSNLRKVLDATRLVHDGLDLTATLQAIVEGVTLASGFGVASASLRRPDGAFETVAVQGGPDVHETLMGSVVAAEQWDRLIALAEPWGQLYYLPHGVVAEIEDVPTWRPALPAPSDPGMWHPDDILFAPLTSASRAILGMFSVDLPRDGRHPDAATREVLTLFAFHAAAAIENALIHAELAETSKHLAWAAQHDALTGLRDRSVLEDPLPALAGRPGGRLLVALLDIDGFKAINDSAGHRIGDEVLVQVADRLRSVVGRDELLARLGGDEFLVVVPLAAGDDVDAAADGFVDRRHAAFTGAFTVGEVARRLRASIGFASAATPVDPARVIAAADQAMYADKRSARTRQPVRGEGSTTGEVLGDDRG